VYVLIRDPGCQNLPLTVTISYWVLGEQILGWKHLLTSEIWISNRGLVVPDWSGFLVKLHSGADDGNYQYVIYHWLTA
jgi:hypothetical protein